MSNGLLIIRLVIGLLMLGHGLQKLFGWFGGPGIKGTAAGFARIGFHPPVVMAWMAAVCETASGALIAAGFLFPAGTAMLVGVMVNAGAVHWPSGLWITNRGYEYTLTLGAIAAGLAFTGPGTRSLDHVFDLDFSGNGWGLAATLVGLAGGTLTLLTRRQGSPVP